MGTYTTNYNLYMPTVGEQGWGELVNGNFLTIDTTMKELDTRIGTIEPLLAIQMDENQNVTFPAKITSSEFVGGVFNGKLLVNGNDSGTVVIGNMITNEFSYTDTTKGDAPYSVDFELGTSYIVSNNALSVNFDRYCVYKLTFACTNIYNYNTPSLTFTVKIGDEIIGSTASGTLAPGTSITKELIIKVPENSTINVSRNYGAWGAHYDDIRIVATITQGDSVPIYL